MSKSKKNTIDPENIISNYGADAARLFILSDSPPEKDVQWSEEGIISAFKFIQKLWKLNLKILDEIKKDHKKDSDKELLKNTNKFLKQITENLESFSYNKIVANLYEIYSFFIKQTNKSYTKRTLIENYEKILIAMMPVVPHLSNECLKNLSSKNIKWPEYDETILLEKTTNIVIQINGKKRGLLKTDIDTSEEKLIEKINKDETLKKYFNDKVIEKQIYVKNKLINFIVNEK
jgi:leucyl-tRNA synthetase